MESVSTRKKFEIINFEPPYQPAEKTLPDFVTVADLTSNFESGDSGRHHLYLTHEAMSHITTHIGWGQKTQHNCIEQGGILLGQAFRDSEGGTTYGVVNAAIAALSARGSSVHLEMPHEAWKEMLDSADRLLEASPHQEMHVIGWYHTHPNGLDVFMSGTDRETQKRMFALDWQFAMVLNPQKSQWRSFFGAEAEECRGFVIAAENPSAAVEPPQSVSFEDIEPAQIQNIVIEPPITTQSVNQDPAPRRRRKAKPSTLLKICMILLFVILVLQLVTLGLVSMGTLLRTIVGVN